MAAQMSRVTKMVVIVCLLSQLIMLVEGEEEEGGSVIGKTGKWAHERKSEHSVRMKAWWARRKQQQQQQQHGTIEGSKHNGDDSSKTPKKAAPGAPTNSADGHKTPHTKQSTTPPYTEQEKEEVDMIKKLKEQGRR
ncbi:hypothetical protein M8J77_004456 [Diaphorina citri]|nr:hypothetical protein M8J77_004456 [Diaphorina citri]